jgi:hypothetical protein
VDDLHAAIAAHLRERNTRLTVERAPIERVWQDSVRPLALMRCRRCGGPLLADASVTQVEALGVADGDLGALGPLLAARLCVGCYLQSEAA